MDDDMARTSILESLEFQSMAFGRGGVYHTSRQHGWSKLEARRTYRFLKIFVEDKVDAKRERRMGCILHRSSLLGLQIEANRGKELFVR